MERAGSGVATVWLADADVNNAWSPDLERDYYAALRDLDADRGVRAIVVTGRGRHFCPGASPGQIQAVIDHGPQLEKRLSPIGPLMIDTPLIAAVNGGCAGMGLLQALLCDVRFASSDTKFSAAFTRRGLAGEHGVTWILPRMVGLSRAMDLLLSGRVVAGEEALSIGLATFLTSSEELLGAAQQYAMEVATNCSPVSTALVRHQVWADLDRSLGDALIGGGECMDAAWRAGHLTEGLGSLREKRPAAFESLPSTMDAATTAGRRVSQSPYRHLAE